MNRGTITIPMRGTTGYTRDTLPITIREVQTMIEDSSFFSDIVTVGETYEGAGIGENISINIS